MTNNFQFGVDYYPEHWPEERWATDAALMRDMGLKVVRMAEFAWAKMEPSPGNFDFSWLDRAVDLLFRHGLKTVLGTPSAAPPAWLVEKHPEILPVDSRGTVRGFGGRHHDCQSNATYRGYVAKIVTAMAKHYGNDPRIAGWQPDNEFGNSHDDFCHCSSCRRAFGNWLQNRYGTVQKLNAAWGTVFWSQTYDRFDQIDTPKINPNSHNPSMLLDWKRFHSDLIVDFQQKQIDILKAHSAGQFITHNFMAFFDLIDYFDLAAPLDFVSYDQYPTGYWETPPGRSPASLAGSLDIVAGLKGKPFWLMEQQAGPTGWQILGRTPRPGQLALWAAQSIAHGADTVVFFRWRSCTVGTEQFWHGILPHNGVPGHRYDELKSLISVMSPVMPGFEGGLNQAEVAVLYSYEQNWAFEIQPHHPDLDYVKIAQDVYQAFHERNIPVSFISAKASLSRYKLVVAPLMFLEIPGVVEALRSYVEAGGHLVLTARTGVKTETNVCQTAAALPGPYSQLLGIEVLDYDCLRNVDVDVRAGGAPGVAGALDAKDIAEAAGAPGTGDMAGKGRLWWDVVTPKKAETLLRAGAGDHAGEPALTKNAAGKGFAWYLPTFPDETLMRTVVSLWAGATGVRSLGHTAPGVELCLRPGPREEFLFVLNHSAAAQRHDPGAEWTVVAGGVSLPAFGYSIFKRARG